MNTFDIILQQVGLFVIYILAGLLLVKTKVLNRETLEPISKFVIKMALLLLHIYRYKNRPQSQESATTHTGSSCLFHL